MNLRIAFTIAFIGVAPRLVAQTVRPAARLTIPTTIDALVTGGHWETANVHGRFRVVIERQGWEEIRRVARLEWIREGDAHTPEIVVQQRNLMELVDAYALSEPVIAARRGEWILSVNAARAPIGPYDQQILFRLGDEPGRVSRLHLR